MKKFLIGSCLVGLMMATAPAMADSYKRENHKAGYHQKADYGKGAPHHKKFLTSQHRDRYADHGYGDRKHGWKHKKYHQHKHGYHGHKRHWNKSRHHQRYDHDSRYRFRYNGGYHPVEQGIQLLIDVTR
ncbi:MAG: hypothetical protein ABJM11_16250 [Marinobacter sp.]|uniref:hypothetical protein n=1 Tax=Marinobacter sp. TaxID=50741 RepID=UPI0032998DC5